MLSLRITATPVTLKASPSHQYSPFSPFGKHATFTAVLADASNSPAGHPPPFALCHLNEVQTRASGLPFLTQPPQVFNNDGRRGKNDFGTSPNSASPSRFAPDNTHSIFPVYGPFDLMYCLQTGGFGSAWAAKDRGTGRLLCLKVFQSVQNPDVRRSVRVELKTFKRLVKSRSGERGKQFIMELNRSMQHGSDVLFAMELMTTDLGAYFCFEPERCKLHARRWTAQIALGIQSLHEMAIIHRDIKTENILIDSRENVRIIDFGLAYLGRSNESPRAMDFLGTPPYMAPEMLRNKGLPSHQKTYYGAEIDWWGLGCILFELESRGNQLLFDTDRDVDAYVTWSRSSGNLEQPYPGFDGLHPVVVNLLEGLLQVEPSKRYSLNDMEKHAYFWRRDGSTEFDNAAARALERRVRPELVPQFAGDRQPVKIIDAAKLATAYDWTNLKWALANG